MDARAILEKAQDAMSARSVYGEPYSEGGVTVIPVAAVRGGGGAGGEEQASGGGGFGLSARPVGAYVIRQGEVRWKPAIDVERVIIGGYVVAVVAALTMRSLANGRR